MVTVVPFPDAVALPDAPSSDAKRGDALPLVLSAPSPLHRPPSESPFGLRASSSQLGLYFSKRPSAFAIACAWSELGRAGNFVCTSEIEARAKSPLFSALATLRSCVIRQPSSTGTP